MGHRSGGTVRVVGALWLGAMLALVHCGPVTEPVPLPPAPIEPGEVDSGTDASVPDDGGTDGGPDGGVQGPRTRGFLGANPWTTRTFGRAQGILETPIVGVTTDEAENLWVATHAALYLMKSGGTTFQRFVGHDGLHLQDNPQIYCDTWIGPADSGTAICPVPGAAADPGITEIIGGKAGEVFVGYAGDDSGHGDKYDAARHSGKLDRVRLKADGTLEVKRFDMVAGNHGAMYWHNRTVQRLIYDHYVRPGELFVGSNHGVDLMVPDRFREPRPGEWFDAVNMEWMADHLHARVCYQAHCVSRPNDSEENQRMGDWRGLALDAHGGLWTAGKWTAGLIAPVDASLRNDADPTRYLKEWFMRPGDVAFSESFGDPYPSGSGDFVNEPVFRVPYEGHPVHLSAVTVAPDGRAWFASGPPGSGFELVAYGLAVWDGRRFQTYSPTRDLGLPEEVVWDLQALPDGRLAIALPNGGVYLWSPATNAVTRLTGLADNRVHRLGLDDMVSPPALLVSTDLGATVHRLE